MLRPEFAGGTGVPTMYRGKGPIGLTNSVQLVNSGVAGGYCGKESRNASANRQGYSAVQG